jgi:hypothetical protein
VAASSRTVVSRVRACVIPGSGTGRAGGGSPALGSISDVVSFAVQRIADPGLVDRFTRRLSLTERGRGSVYTGAAKGYVDYKTFDQMAGELRA